jgi:hypothetical protein
MPCGRNGGSDRWKAQIQQQATAGNGAGGEETTAGDARAIIANLFGAHDQASLVSAVGSSAACLMAARMRVYVAHRQMLPLMASSMSRSVGLGF